jgi:CDP-diacylglycerol--serine O-phosphatidyltransferase
MSTPRRHFSMLRDFHVADWFTLANAICGAGAVLAAMAYAAQRDPGRLWLALALVPIALVFDVLDGRVARWRHEASSLGRELDSLADVISFGMAPAAIAYAAGLDGGIDAAILVFFVACGVGRLARYNVTAESMAAETGKVTYFEGTPIPTSVLLVGVVALALALDRIGESIWLGAKSIGALEWHPLSLLWLVSGTLMVSKTLRIPKP